MGIHFRGEPEGPKLFFDSMCTITSKNHKLNKLRYESSTLILYKALSSSIFQV